MMYGIKRNVKIGNKVVGAANKVEPIVKKNSRKLKSNGYGKYKFPIYDDVPAGNYFSEVKAANPTITKSGKEAVEVFYEIKDGTTCYKIANGILPEDAENKPYYIKQVYPEGSQYYDNFVDSMAEALNKDEFDYNDIVGITEYNTLSYDKGDVGGFSKRMPFNFEDFIEENQEDEEDYVY